MEFLKAPSELDLSTTDSISIQEKWRKWRQAMELYLQFSMSEKTEKERCGAFLYLIGQSGRDVYNTMTITNAEKDKLDVPQGLCIIGGLLFTLHRNQDVRKHN